MKNSKGVSLIALIITIIVIIILAAIVMNASTSTVGNAQYARFAQEFGEYSDQVALDAAEIKSNTGIRGQIINNAQMYFMVANKLTSVGTSGDGVGVAGFTLPVGYVLTNHNNPDQTYKYVLQSILGIGDVSGEGKTCTAYSKTTTANPVVPSEASEVCYIIRDSAITNYTDGNPKGTGTNGQATHEFYGDSNGPEYHFITSNGQVFTLPGYPVTQSDGTIEYHIDTKNGHYYVAAGNSGIAVGQPNVNGDTVTNTVPILASYLEDMHGVDATTNHNTQTQGSGAIAK